MRNPMNLTLDELKKDDFYLSRPKIIQDAIDKYPPTRYYTQGILEKECYIVGYTEAESGLFEDITCMVKHTGFSKHGYSPIHEAFGVFGIKLTDLKPIE